jgi:hypothetical protein
MLAGRKEDKIIEKKQNRWSSNPVCALHRGRIETTEIAGISTFCNRAVGSTNLFLNLRIVEIHHRPAGISPDWCFL